MKAKRSLAVKFTRMLVLSGLCCVLLYFIMEGVARAGLSRYFATPSFRQNVASRCVEGMQEYITENGLSTKDNGMLMDWAKKHNVLMMELYRDGRLLYSSLVPNDLERRWEDGEDERSTSFYDLTDHYDVTFSDGEAEVALFCDPTYFYYGIVSTMLLVVCVMLFLGIFLLECSRIIRYIYQLSDEIQAMEGGDLEHPITIRGDDELATLAQCLDSMRMTLRQQQQEDAEASAKMKSLITEMSHDLRTPLTTLLLYTEIVRKHKYETDAQREDYLAKIESKGKLLKQLSDNLFEYALVTRETDVMLDEPTHFSQIFEEPLAEMVDTLQQRGFTCALELGSEDMLLQVNGQYVRRILDNVCSNIFKYADAASLVHVNYMSVDGAVGLCFKNRVLTQPSTAESTKVGLSSIKTMMKKMHAKCYIEQDTESFAITLMFPVCDGSGAD